MLRDERYDTPAKRRQRKHELNADIEAAIAERTVDELVECVNAVGVPCGPVNDVRGGFDNPQAKFLRMAKPAAHGELGDLNLIRSPINLSRFPHPERFDHAAPDPGQDADAILDGFGIAREKAEQLRSRGAIQ